MNGRCSSGRESAGASSAERLESSNIGSDGGAGSSSHKGGSDSDSDEDGSGSMLQMASRLLSLRYPWTIRLYPLLTRR